MNNLTLSSEISSNLQFQSSDESLRFSAFDIEHNRLFFLSTNNSIYTTHLSALHDERAWKNQTFLPAEVGMIDLDHEDFVTSFDYLMEKEALIVGTSDGLLLLHNVEAKTTEVVGKVEGGVKWISPSPDGELLGIITGFGQILVMTHNWDLLYENAMEDLPEGLDVREPSFSAEYMFESPISWRGDGKYFATLSHVWNSTSSLKKLKVWERDSGVLHSSSEPKDFVQTVLEWMPSGAKIATVYDKRAENKCPSIVFFERNGLERSTFSINEGIDAAVRTLKWNCSSDLLAGIVRCENHDSIKIWFFSNNHWYLKHEIRYGRQDEVQFMWNLVRPLQLICWTTHGEITVYNFIWNTAVKDNSTALVIDGSNVHVTPLSLCLLPLPMYLFSLKFSSAVCDITLYSRNLKNQLAVFLSNGCLSVVELPTIDTWEDFEGKEFIVDICSTQMALGSIVHFTWLDSHILLVISHYGFSHSNYISQASPWVDGLHGFYLQEIELVCSENQVPGLLSCSGWHAEVLNQNFVEGMTIGISSNPASKCSAYIQSTGGKILEYKSKMGYSAGLLRQDEKCFSSSCPWMSVVPVGSGGLVKPLLFGLDEYGKLHVNERIVCYNCSSFTFYSNSVDQVITHLIIATKQDLLFVIDMNEVLNEELVSIYENFISIDGRKREEDRKYINIWEKGAKIIGVLHGDETAIILQTTRGNLECIYPRKLVLTSIINALVNNRFKDALLMVRRHRIDFNIIVDHCSWQTFIQSASEFVKQVNNLSSITDFVCAIKNENVTETLYKNYMSHLYPKGTTNRQAIGIQSYVENNKVSSILMAIRKALEEHVPESPARELCILTTLARSDPPLLEDALKRIKVTRELELSGSEDPRKVSYPSAEEALKHLLWLCDSEAVYEAALGLYDLNLAAIVALNSQKDPKEFLPFLQDLERLPIILMHYNIDLKLERFDKALKHISAAGDTYYEDCLSLLKENPQLFPLGNQLTTDPTKKLLILDLWGDYLSNEKCYEDAAMTYLSCSSFEKALKCYRACGNWGGVLTVASLLKMGKDEIEHLAHELCEELQALGKPGDAAKIAMEYCHDIERSVSLLICAHDWEEALRTALMHQKENLISEVKNTCLESASMLISEYEDGLEKVGKYLARYLAVRQRRLLLAAKIRSEEQLVNDLEEDAASEVSSNFSGMSVYTTGTRKSSAAASMSSSATSKARDTRRQRKRGKIRPGSPDEEFALVEHLKGMSLTTGAMHELKSLLISLVMFGEDETARKVQRTAENFQLSQMAAVKLADDTVSTEDINEHAHTLEHYTSKARNEMQNSEVFSWRYKVFLAP